MKITTDSLYKSNPLTYGHVIRCFHKLSEIISLVLTPIDKLKETNPNKALTIKQ